jgi:hypothetical protein
MKTICVASLCLVVAFVAFPRFAHAQGPTSSLAARIAALEARVAKLESGAVVEADLVGTYGATIFALDLQNVPHVQTETAVGTITLNADHTASFAGTGAHCKLAMPAAWTLSCDPSETGPGSGEATWKIEGDGSTSWLVVQNEDGDDVINDPNFIGAGGRMIISGGTGAFPSSAAPVETYSLIMILIKLPATPLPVTPE